MITAVRGKKTIVVSENAFERLFKPQGFEKVGTEEVASEAPADENTEETEDEKFMSDILESPISEWSAKDVKRFAAIKGVDITGTKNAAEAKQIIKEFLEKEE